MKVVHVLTREITPTTFVIRDVSDWAVDEQGCLVVRGEAEKVIGTFAANHWGAIVEQPSDAT